jgi:alkylation response protein AidB-like acyl-CoA dehydrogenase
LDLTLSADEQAFRDKLRAWLDDNHPGSEPADADTAFEFRRDWQKRLHAAGYTGLSWPAEFGGQGATLIEQALFNEELARAEAPMVANPLAIAMGGPTVIAHGTEAQKQRFLPPILSADEIWCQGFSEPESGSDLASVATRAERTEGGWRVSGQKVWTSLAHYADWCMLLARTDIDADKHKGLTYLLVDMDQPGVSVRPLTQITGDAEFNEIFFDDAEVADETVVGGVGEGWGVALTTLMHERATLAFGLVVSLKIALGELMQLARDQGLADDPVVRQRIGQLYTEAEVMRLNAYRGLTQQMKHGVPGPEGSLGKWHWSEVNQSLTEAALDFGGPGSVLAGSQWAHRFLRSRANSIEGGTTEILKNVVAERVLGLPRLR